MAERVVEDPVFRTRYAFERVTGDGGEDVLHVKMWVDPGGGVPPHLHPAMEERFEVLEGRPEFLAGRRWQAAGPGEEVVVPPGTRHAFRNRGDEVAHVLARVRPPSTLQEFLEDTAGLSRAGKINRLGMPKSFSGLLQASVMLEAYRDMVVILSPPPLLQRLFVGPLARLGQRRGYRAGTFAAAG
jgi:quercetin dioxygenase-like cupin family protein